LVVDVAPVVRTDLTRLVWCSDRSGTFVPFVDVGHLFGRHVSAAVRTVTRRENLDRAIAARHRIGQAQGILMARHELTAEEAFQALKRHSQRTNVKLHTIADKIIGGRPTFIG
jgi:AmiR/NasT family two-component response regulator